MRQRGRGGGTRSRRAGWRSGELIIKTPRIIIIHRGETRSRIFFGILNFF